MVVGVDGDSRYSMEASSFGASLVGNTVCPGFTGLSFCPGGLEIASVHRFSGYFRKRNYAAG
jgi:hypothetical protein